MMDECKFVVVASVLVPFFAQSFKEDLVKSDHSNCSYHAPHHLEVPSGAQRECLLQILKRLSPFLHCYKY